MRRISGPGATLGAAVIGLSGLAAAQEQAPPSVILRETVEGMPRGERQEVHVLGATIPVGESTVFHTHRFPVTVHVLDGAFTLEVEGRETVTVRAGRSVVEPANVRMTGHNRGDEATRLLIFYVADPGTPFLDPVH
jgi:quercetin dioxygenase-like cupin family protein